MPSFHSSLAPDELHIRLFDSALLLLPALSWSAQNVQSSFWRFYRNTGDGAALELRDGLYPLQGGRLYLVPAGVRFNCRNVGAVEHFYVHFDVLGLPLEMAHGGFDAPLCLPCDEELESMTLVVSAQVAQGDLGLAVSCRIKALLLAVLACWMEHLPPHEAEDLARLARAREAILPALRHIEAHPGQPISNGRLANTCHLSEDHFIRRFRECMGQSPSRYGRERRIALAAQRLLFTRDSIEQVAAATGFGNRFYFSRIFARHTGLSPAAYRKSSRV